MAKKFPIFNKYFIILMAVNFTVAFSYYITFVTTTSFSINVLHTSNALAGLASGIFIIGALVARLIFGSMADRIYLKPVLVVTLFIYFLATLVYIFINQYIPLVILRFIHGAVYGTASTCLGVILSQNVPASIRGSAIGYYGLSIVLASAIAPFLAILFIHMDNINLSFVIPAILLFISVFLSIYLRVKKVKRVYVKQKFSLSNYIEYSALPVSFLAFLMTASYMPILSFIGDYSMSINLVEAGSWFFIFYAGVSMFSRPASGRLFDNLGHNFVLLPSIIIFMVALIMLSISDNSFLLLFSAVLTGLGYGSFFSSGQSYALFNAPRNRLGLATSTYYIFLDIGGGIGPYIFGFAGEKLGYSAMYQISALLVFIVLILYFIMIFRNKKDSGNN